MPREATEPRCRRFAASPPARCRSSGAPSGKARGCRRRPSRRCCQWCGLLRPPACRPHRGRLPFCDVYEGVPVVPADADLVRARVVPRAGAFARDEHVIDRCPDCDGELDAGHARPRAGQLRGLPARRPSALAHRRRRLLDSRLSAVGLASTEPNVFAGPYADRVRALRKDTPRSTRAARGPAACCRCGIPAHRCAGRRRLVDRHRGPRRFEVAPSSDWILLGMFRGELASLRILGRAAGRSEPSRTRNCVAPAAASRPTGRTACHRLRARALVLWRAQPVLRHLRAPTADKRGQHVMTCTRGLRRRTPASRPGHHRAGHGRRARVARAAGRDGPGPLFDHRGLRRTRRSLGMRSRARYWKRRRCRRPTARPLSSQPWPFPSSLMIRLPATAAPGDCRRADEELEDVRWFSREDIAARRVGLPFPQSISFRLIGTGTTRARRRGCDTPGVRSWGRGER